MKTFKIIPGVFQGSSVKMENLSAKINMYVNESIQNYLLSFFLCAQIYFHNKMELY